MVGLNLAPLTSALEPDNRSRGVYERLVGVTGIQFLVKTDISVDEQEGDDMDEIFLICWPVLAVGQGDSDESSGFHDPGEWVPHEAQKLNV